jgi:iron complex outermembrane recepter protein
MPPTAWRITRPTCSSHNQPYDSAEHGEDWSGGVIARWQPNDSLLVTPFWSASNHREFGEKPDVFIGTPVIHAITWPTPMGQPWANLDAWSSNFGTVARWSFGQSWLLAVGVFRALVYLPISQIPFLNDTNGLNQGDYTITAIPPADTGSTSGEVRLAKLFNTAHIRHTFYLRMTGRDSSIESGPGDTKDIGPATLQACNLAATYGLTPNASGQITAFDARRFELSLIMDL